MTLDESPENTPPTSIAASAKAPAGIPATAKAAKSAKAGAPAKAGETRAWVDFAKGAAIILIVLYHAGLFLDEFGLAPATSRLRSLLLFFPMPLFFFVAGLTATRMRTWSFPDLWRRRLLTYVWLYLLWSVIRVVFYLIVPFRRAGEESPTDPLQIALIPVLPTSSYWFIWALAIFTLLAWLLRRVPAWMQITGAVVLAIASTTPGLLDFNNVGWDRVAQNFAFFIVASFVPQQVYRLAAKTRIWHAVALTLAYLGLAGMIVLLNLSRIPSVVLITSVVAVAAGIAASVLLARVRWLDVVNTMGRHSFPIYLLHLFVIAVVASLLGPIANFSIVQRASIALPYLLAGFALFASFYLFRLLRPVSWLWVSPFSIRGRRWLPVLGARRRSQPAAMPGPRTDAGPRTSAGSGTASGARRVDDPRRAAVRRAAMTPSRDQPRKESSVRTTSSADE